MTLEAEERGGLRNVVIVGDGVAAWMAAAALAQALGASTSVRILGTDQENADAFEADTIPPVPPRGRLALWRDEDRLVETTDGAFGWGIALSGWAVPGAAWFHPFGSIGANLGPVPFHQLVMRLRHDGIALRLADYSLAALAAQAGRFVRPSADARSALSTCRYAVHTDVHALAHALRAMAGTAGAERVPGSFRDAERAHDGRISAVTASDGSRLEAELFLDCTGSGALIGTGGWEDWSAWFPCNRLLAARIGNGGRPPPWSQAEAHAAGWTRHLPLGTSTMVTSFHADSAGGRQAALESLRRAAGNAEHGDVQSTHLRFGRRRETWRGNCVALGAAAATIDPVAVSNLELLQSAIVRLLELLPAGRHADAQAREYNRRTAMELDNARDFAIALYRTNGRNGEAFWDERRAMPAPDSLEYRMRVYGSLGRVVLYDEEPLEDSSWISLFDEQGLKPSRHHPMADGFKTADLEKHVARVRAIMIEELKKMPAHAEYLARLKSARPPLHSAAGGETTA